MCDDAGEVLGRMALTRLNLAEGSGELGYWTLPAARGRGVAPDAIGIVRAWGFEKVGLQRIHLAHSVHNEQSCRVANKAGFEAEGTLRSALHHADGWHDMHLHATIRPRG